MAGSVVGIFVGRLVGVEDLAAVVHALLVDGSDGDVGAPVVDDARAHLATHLPELDAIYGAADGDRDVRHGDTGDDARLVELDAGHRGVARHAAAKQCWPLVHDLVGDVCVRPDEQCLHIEGLAPVDCIAIGRVCHVVRDVTVAVGAIGAVAVGAVGRVRAGRIAGFRRIGGSIPSGIAVRERAIRDAVLVGLGVVAAGRREEEMRLPSGR